MLRLTIPLVDLGAWRAQAQEACALRPKRCRRRRAECRISPRSTAQPDTHGPRVPPSGLHAADDLREAADALAQVAEAALLERAGDLVALEHALSGLRAEHAVDRAHRRRPRATAHEERDPAAGGEDARHVVEGG